MYIENKKQHGIKQTLTSVIGMIVFIVLGVISFFVFSYLLVFAALVGLIIFLIVFIRAKWLQHKYKHSPSATHEQGRIIDQEKD